jgi:type VI secretion system secreted protein VgrG
MASALDVGGSLFGSEYEDITCRVRITGVDDAAVRVAAFQVDEGLSQLFSFELEVATDPREVANLEKVLGADATVILERNGDVERIAHGIVTDVEPDGVFVGKGQARTVLVVEPRLANLRYSGGHRIFQDMSVKDIVAQLVAPEQIEVEWRVIDEPPKRDYRTQLDETDLDFLMRLAADEGHHFFFDHSDEKTTLVFTDETRGFRELEKGSTFPFRDTSGAVTGEHVRTIRRAQRVRTGALEHRDFDFKHPHLKLVSRMETEDPQSEANTKRRELREYPGRFVDPDAEGMRRARMRLQELRSDAYTIEGTASSLRLLSGRTFTVAHHDDKAFNRELVLTRVAFGGSVAGSFNRGTSTPGHGRASASLVAFEAVPVDTKIRPKRRPKPMGRLQTARVVGPKEGDPFLDESGRIKVQFVWDRDGADDEHSSCWMRMATPNAYDQGGIYSPHRVGSEVLVDFIDGDIDRPVVRGGLYNELQRQPNSLPDNAALSTWIERSVPGGDGYNGITYDNTAAKEKITTHAERDRVAHVGHNDTETIGANQTTTVGANQSTTVGANRTATIGANDATTVGGDRTENVAGNESVTVVKSRSHTVNGAKDDVWVTDGDRSVNVLKGNHTRDVKLLDKLEADNEEIHARYDVHVTGDRKVQVKQGDTTATFEGGNVELEAAGHVRIHHKSTTVLIDEAGKVTIDAAPELEVNCQGAQVKMGAGKIALQAPTEVQIAVGQNGVKVSKTGVEITGASVKSSALSGMNEVSGLAVKLN